MDELVPAESKAREIGDRVAPLVEIWGLVVENNDDNWDHEEEHVEHHQSPEEHFRGRELVVYDLLDCILLVEIYVLGVVLDHHVGQVLVVEHEFRSFVLQGILIVVQFLSDNHVLEVQVSMLDRDGPFLLFVVLILVPLHDLINNLRFVSVEVSECGQLEAFDFLV